MLLAPPMMSTLHVIILAAFTRISERPGSANNDPSSSAAVEFTSRLTSGICLPTSSGRTEHESDDAKACHVTHLAADDV